MVCLSYFLHLTRLHGPQGSQNPQSFFSLITTERDCLAVSNDCVTLKIQKEEERERERDRIIQ